MKVLLAKNVDALGQIGDIVDVADGYGRNYLLPHNIALPVTKENILRMEKERQDYLKREQERREALEALAEKLETVSLTIPMRAGDEDQLYGSVSSSILIDELAGQNIQLEEKHIQLDEPIKSLGEHEFVVRLSSDLKVPVKVWVVRASEEGGISAMDTSEEGGETASEEASESSETAEV